MAKHLSDWRKREEDLETVIEKYPDVSPFVILKTDVQRRGYILSKEAEKRLDPSIHLVHSHGVFGDSEAGAPNGLVLRDGTLIVGSYADALDVNSKVLDPYVIDVRDDKLVITDEDRVYEEVEYWRKPDFFDKTTSKGTPMWQILGNRPQRLDLNLNQHCHFWDEAGGGCKYCTIGAVQADRKKKNISLLLDEDEVVESFREALKQEGRFITVCATAGTILTGKEVLDDEVDLYVRVLNKLLPLFETDHIHLQLVGTAYNKKQLERLKEAGLIAYTSDLEVLNDRLFQWICPGKAKYIGYEEWKHRLYDAVDVFGKGSVNTGIIGGIELSQPHGYQTEAEALKNDLAEAEELAKHGVSTINTVWHIGENTIFKNQIPPTLDYYVQLAKGLNDIREAYDIDVYLDDYRRCGNHPGTDLARI